MEDGEEISRGGVDTNPRTSLDGKIRFNDEMLEEFESSAAPLNWL